MTPPQLSHINPATGQANMVDIAHKPTTQRSAAAEALVTISTDLAQAIRENTLAKGDLLATARIAGITAAKQTANLIPLCHQLPLDSVHVEAQLETTDPSKEGGGAAVVRITATANTSAKTGVEMEALTAASIAALTVYDMGKAIDKSITIQHIRLLKKTGGQSGNYTAPPTP